MSAEACCVLLPPVHLDSAGQHSLQDKAFTFCCLLLCSLLAHVAQLPVCYGSIIIVSLNAHNPMKRLWIRCSLEWQVAPDLFAITVWDEKVCFSLPAYPLCEWRALKWVRPQLQVHCMLKPYSDEYSLKYIVDSPASPGRPKGKEKKKKKNHLSTKYPCWLYIEGLMVEHGKMAEEITCLSEMGSLPLNSV